MIAFIVSLFFWPLIILSVILSLAGIAAKKPLALYISAACIVPTSLYLVNLQWGSILVPLLYIAAGLFVRRDRWPLALFCVAPVYVLIGWLAYTVLTQ